MWRMALERIDFYYDRLKSCSSTSGRKNNGFKILDIMEEHPMTKHYWEYRPNEFYWPNRFFKKRDTERNSLRAAPIFEDEDTNLRKAPSYGGLYFFGCSNLNPLTHEEFYSVKIGISSDIRKRASTYRTCNPMIYPIGFKECEDYAVQESWYQAYLSQIALYKNQNNDEWWFVDRETYLEMREKKFDYFI